MCGFIGIVGSSDDVAGDIYEGLLCLQHRGQDAAGIISYDGRFRLKKGGGLVGDIFNESNMQRLTGPMAIGHVRYPTIGSGSTDDAQPFHIHYPYGIAMCHNGNVTNYSELVTYFANDKKAHLNSTCDVEVILNMLALELGKHGVPDLQPELLFDCINVIFDKVRGSYSVVTMIAGFGMVAFRDPFGVKPMVWGSRTAADGSIEYASASENVALEITGFSNIVDMAPGEVRIFRPGQESISRILRNEKHSPCIFEHVYFARPDSVMDKVSVYKTRRRFGKKLADRIKKLELDIDVVIPVPDSACTAALTLAQELEIKYREGLVKNRYIGRTFIMPNQQERRKSIRRKLNAIPLEFKDKNVLLVDDSIVRGNTSKQIVELARAAGAKKVYFASCSPEVAHPCVYGIDMATKQELIARDKSAEEIGASIGADFLIYQKLDDLRDSALEGNPELKQFCTACFSGDYPTNDISPDLFSEIERERLGID